MEFPIFDQIMETTSLQVTRKNQLVDESFSNGMVEHPVLLAMLDDDQFIYGIIDRERHKAVVLKEYRIVPSMGSKIPDNFFQQILDQDELLRDLKPAKTVFAVHPNCAVLVPSPLFSKEYAKDILALSCKLTDDARMYADQLKMAEAHLVYGVTESILKQTGSHFKEANLFHANTAYIESQLRLNKHEQETILSVHVRKSSIDLVATKGSELLFSNIFKYKDSEDFIYYLLYTLEQLQLNPDKTAVRFYGEIDKTSASWMVSKKYIRNISLGEQAEGIDFSYGFEQLSSHIHYLLFSQYLCVS
ncbi:hypothetical protein BH11BAC2_BH11BAC2_12410 [soil metagenome]